MKFSRTILHQRLENLPMLRVLIPVVCGILLGDLFHLPLFFLWVAMLLSALLMLSLRSNLYALLFLFFGGFLSVEWHHHLPLPPQDQEGLFRLYVDTDPVERRYRRSTATIEAWQDNSGQWHECLSKASIYGDSTLTVRAGERLLVRGTLRSYDSRYPDYAELMYRRGFSGTLFLSDRGLLARDSRIDFRLGQWLHQAGVMRIQRLHLSPDNEAVLLAMVTGERGFLSATLRTAYARSGASHLLAVSGLHVGMLFLCVNLLFGWLALFRWGHLLRNLLSIGFIWLFAVMTGATPSVLRAAWMFTLLQGALFFTLDYRGVNILFAVATGMLLLFPFWLYDLSFQLSFIAVLAILAFPRPPCQLRVGSRWSRSIVQSLWIGLVATCATLPLVSLRFGIIAPIGILFSPFLILIAQGLLSLSLGWLLFPLSGAERMVSWLLEAGMELQNGMVLWLASQEHVAFDYRFSIPVTAVIYLLFVVFTLWMWGVDSKKKVSLSHDEPFDRVDDDSE